MDYAVSVSSCSTYILCRVSGGFTADEARAFALEVEQLGREKDIKRFLFDVREAVNESSIFRNYEYAYNDMPEMGLTRAVRSAILASPEDRSHDFVETLCQNAGYNVQLFKDEQEARAWLKE
ncbi:MAG: STAS/SEC14 domain-containing protein [Thermodesulfobacteriota bacterium]|nr:STAS/SEC14 domain-containing protein [Thermodesulfobacteriota bacterium]